MSALTIDRIAGALGAELTGLDLTRRLGDDELVTERPFGSCNR